MRKNIIRALLVISIFLLVVGVVYTSLNQESSKGTPIFRLSYGYIGYAFVGANTTLEFHGMLVGKDLGPGFSISVTGIPKEIQRKTGIRDISCPNKFKGVECKDITLLLTPGFPGSYDLSDATITVTSNSESLPSKLGNVKLEVISNTFNYLKPVYYPYAGAYLRSIITPNLTFYYYTVFKNSGNESIRVIGAKADSSLITTLGLYYQEIPLNVSPLTLDVPNINKAKVVPQDGLLIKPGNIVAIIVPVKIKVQAENAIISLKFEIKYGKSEKLTEVPGIPYYILGGNTG